TGIAVVSGGGQSGVVGTVFPNPLVVKVTDGFGNPVPGVTVTFAGPASGAGPTLPGGATATTDASGRASVAVGAGTMSGSYAVTASAPGVSGSASFTLTNITGAATHLDVVSGGGQSAAVNTAFGAALVAKVTDAFGNPVSGAVVS